MDIFMILAFAVKMKETLFICISNNLNIFPDKTKQ